MRLDLRISMGLMFTFIGVILSTWGIKTNDNVLLYTRSLGINVNLWWGIALLVFGIAVYVLGQRSRRRGEDQALARGQKEKARRNRQGRSRN